MSLDSVTLVQGIEFIVSVSLMLIFGALAVYFSFSAARISTVRIYRDRAVLTGLLSLGLILLPLTAFVFGGTPTHAPPENQVTTFAVFLIFAFWIDNAIRTSIDEDFFHRDTLRWKFVRFPFLIFVGVVFPLATIGPIGFIGNFANFVINEILGVPAIILLVVGIVALFISGTRTKEKSTRRYLQWLGVALLFLVLQFALPLPFSLRAAFPLAISAYFLLRMSLSLSPTKKFDKQIEVPPT